MSKKQTPKKQLVFILQSKGGVGKSFLTWLYAQHYKDNERVSFIDVDSSTQTSSARLSRFVDEGRVSHLHILDAQQRLDREGFLNLLERLSTYPDEKIILDLGAPESAEFLKFLTVDYSAEILKETEADFGVEYIFNIVMAGTDALPATTKYTRELIAALDGQFDTKVYVNMGLSGNANDRQRIYDMAVEQFNVPIVPFGDLGYSQSAKDIMDYVGGIKETSSFAYAGKLKLREVLKDFAKSLQKSEKAEEVSQELEASTPQG